MSVRLRRLQSDYEQIQARLRSSRSIVVRKVTGDPPERYEIEYRLRSLVLQNDGQIVESPSHVAEIILTRAYPHRAPHCKMLTPIFHPNIDPGAICIGDHWAASESLSDLIVRIGQMIAYQTYNTKSPRNGEAARWADEHKDLLPVDATDLIPPETEETPGVVPPPLTPQPKTTHCQNCGASSSQQTLARCIGGHLACPDCVVHCEKCDGTLCLLCESVACSICNNKGCARCLKTCADCGKAACAEHFVRCTQCAKESCSTCVGSCSTCGKSFCKTHFRLCKSCTQPVCSSCVGTCVICPSGSVHHKSEIAQCAICNAMVCQGHLHASAASGRKIPALPAGHKIAVLPGGAVLGRGLECDIKFDEPTLSRRHCRFIREKTEWLIEDLDSSSGVIINGQKTRGSPLKQGDEIKLGLLCLKVVSLPVPQIMPSTDTVRFTCKCGKVHTVKAVFAGKTAVCKECGVKHLVPAATGSQSPAARQNALQIPALSPSGAPEETKGGHAASDPMILEVLADNSAARQICDTCGVCCATCGNWVGHAEAGVCDTCGKKVCMSCARDCSVCKKKFCPAHAVSCERCGHMVCSKCMTVCPICGKQICRTQSHLASCSVCKRLVCRDCLKTCTDCGSVACRDHMFTCPMCSAAMCSKCVETCAICDKLFHTKHLEECPGCGRRLCSSCGKTCGHCKVMACPEHVISLSRGRLLCVPCFRLREKTVVRTAVLCCIGGIVVLILIGWWLVTSGSH